MITVVLLVTLAAQAAPDTSLRVPGTLLRFGMQVGAVDARIAWRSGTDSLRQGRVSFFGLDAEATLAFSRGLLSHATLNLPEASLAAARHVETQLGRIGYRRTAWKETGPATKSSVWVGATTVWLDSGPEGMVAKIVPGMAWDAARPFATTDAAKTRPPPRPAVLPAQPESTRTEIPSPISSLRGDTLRRENQGQIVIPVRPPPPEPSRNVPARPAVPETTAPETLRFVGAQAPRGLPWPKLIEGCDPVAPHGQAGRVHLEALVDGTGRVVAARVTRSAPGLDSAAVRCARAYRYEPYLANGRPVAFSISLAIVFSPSPRPALEPHLRTGAVDTLWFTKPGAESLPDPLLLERSNDLTAEAGRQGTILLHALVDTTGRVLETRVIETIPGFGDRARASVSRWRWHPYVYRGRALRFWVPVAIRLR